jgi:ABC-type multidrug transport system ATPase subunit
MVDVINVTKKFGSFTALSELSFHVDRASVYGLVGYNGAGKTTLLKTIAGVYKPEGGEVRIEGEPVYENARMKQRLFYVPDELYFQPYANMEKMARFYKGYYPKFSDTNLHELGDLCDHIGLINGQRIVLDCAVDEMSGSRSKFRVVFDRDVEEKDFEGLDIRRFSKDGKIVTLTAHGDSDELEEKLRAMSPVLLETFPLTLEEIFLEEMEGTDYDLTKIFA